MARKFKIPTTKEEAGQFLTDLGALQLEQKKIEESFTRREVQLKAEKEVAISRLQRRLNELFLSLFIFYSRNREELTQRGRISIVELPGGSIQSFLTNPTVNIRNKDRIIEVLKECGLDEFIKVVEDVDKIAILSEPEKVADIPGIKIMREEKFLARPALSNIAITESIKKLKKLLP